MRLSGRDMRRSITGTKQIAPTAHDAHGTANCAIKLIPLVFRLLRFSRNAPAAPAEWTPLYTLAMCARVDKSSLIAPIIWNMKRCQIESINPLNIYSVYRAARRPGCYSPVSPMRADYSVYAHANRRKSHCTR